MELDLESQPQRHTSAALDPFSTSIFHKSQRPITLKFEDVEYRIKGKSKSEEGKSKSSQERVILKGVSGLVLPGEMLAMLGPSGSGKTTLLTALGGRLCGGNLSGSITYNGRPFSKDMNRRVGFVTQDDVHFKNLTVGETLLYTALLRLPRDMKRSEKAAQADAVISQLGLGKCCDSLIGGHLVRGISGGERKRVSIGQEMLVNPSLLFLDEPTSGLDSTTAQRIVSTLRDLANSGRTIVMTIHQPSSLVFYMFHKILLLADGNPIYMGMASGAIDYFSSVGYSPSVAMNPSEFLLDLAHGVIVGDSGESHEYVETRLLVAAYGEVVKPKVEEEMRAAADDGGGEEVEKEPWQWETTWWDQFKVLLERGVKVRRHDSLSTLKMVQVLTTAVLAGLLWWQSAGHVGDQVGLIFFMVSFWGVLPLFRSIFAFPEERVMLEKERSSGTYHLSSFFMARMVGDLPMELVLPTAFVTIVYWMTGLKPTAGHFFHTLSVILLGVLVSGGFGLSLGALVMNFKTANTLASVFILTFLLAGGFYVQRVPPFISWIKYISLSYYTFKLGLLSQFSKGETYLCEDGNLCKVDDLKVVKVADLDRNGVAFAALLSMLVFYRFVAYLALMRVGVARAR